MSDCTSMMISNPQGLETWTVSDVSALSLNFQSRLEDIIEIFCEKQRRGVQEGVVSGDNPMHSHAEPQTGV